MAARSGVPGPGGSSPRRGRGRGMPGIRRPPRGRMRTAAPGSVRPVRPARGPRGRPAAGPRTRGCPQLGMPARAQAPRAARTGWRAWSRWRWQTARARPRACRSRGTPRCRPRARSCSWGRSCGFLRFLYASASASASSAAAFSALVSFLGLLPAFALAEARSPCGESVGAANRATFGQSRSAFQMANHCSNLRSWMRRGRRARSRRRRT